MEATGRQGGALVQKDILGSKMMEELAIAYTQVFGKALQNCPVALQEMSEATS